MRQGPLWIVEPPLSTGEQMSVNDPLLPVERAGFTLTEVVQSNIGGLAL